MTKPRMHQFQHVDAIDHRMEYKKGKRARRILILTLECGHVVERPTVPSKTGQARGVYCRQCPSFLEGG